MTISSQNSPDLSVSVMTPVGKSRGRLDPVEPGSALSGVEVLLAGGVSSEACFVHKSLQTDAISVLQSSLKSFRLVFGCSMCPPVG